MTARFHRTILMVVIIATTIFAIVAFLGVTLEVIFAPATPYRPGTCMVTAISIVSSNDCNDCKNKCKQRCYTGLWDVDVYPRHFEPANNATTRQHQIAESWIMASYSSAQPDAQMTRMAAEHPVNSTTQCFYGSDGSQWNWNAVYYYAPRPLLAWPIGLMTSLLCVGLCITSIHVRSWYKKEEEEDLEESIKRSTEMQKLYQTI